MINVHKNCTKSEAGRMRLFLEIGVFLPSNDRLDVRVSLVFYAMGFKAPGRDQCFHKSTHHNTNIRSISQKLTVLWSVMWIWPSLSCFLLEMSSLFRKHEAPLYLAPFHTHSSWTYYPICNCKPKQSERHLFLEKWGQGWRVQTPDCTKERRSETEKTEEGKEKVDSGGQTEQKVSGWEKLFRL